MYLLGYDVGSSSVKAAIVEVSTGKCVASSFFPKREAPIKSVQPGFAEQNPESWWSYLRDATHSVMHESGVDPCDIKAIGISYQMHGLVALDKNLHPLRDAIIWCDSRGVPYGEKAFADLAADLCLPHLLNSPGNFTASKLAWIRDNEPEIFSRISKVMLPGDYIALRLTGEPSTTVGGLSEMMLWDFQKNTPADFLMDYFGFPSSLLPPITPTFGEQGRLTAKAATELGLKPGTPVTYRAGDQPNNALSLGVYRPGQIAATAGTSGVIYGVIGSPESDPRSRVNSFAHVNHSAEDPRIGVLACINGTGILNSWIRKNIASEGTGYDEMNRLAASVPPGSEGVRIYPFGNGAERLLENRTPGSLFRNIDFNRHTRAHLMRAAQEGIVFAFMYGMEIMKEMGMDITDIHAGNANMFLSPVFRQALADVSGATIRLLDTDGAAGAARGAGIGAGIYASPQEAFSSLREIDTITPDADSATYQEAYQDWKTYLSKIETNPD